MDLVSRQALYNVLLVLDGTLPVVLDQRVQRFQLFAEDSVGRELLNDSAEIELSSIFKDQE